MNIRAKLLLSIGILALSLLLFFSGFGYFIADAELGARVKSNQISQAKNISTEISSWFAKQKAAFSAVHNIVQQPASLAQMRDQPSNTPILRTGPHTPDLPLFFFGFEDSGSLSLGIETTLPEGYDARERPWYQEGKDKAEPGFGKLYVDVESEDFALPIAARVDLDGSFIGVLATDIRLASLVSTFASLSSTVEKGFLILVDQDGLIIGHPDKEKINSTLPDLGASFAGLSSLTLEPGAVNTDMHVSLGDLVYTVAATELPETGWRVYMLQEDSISTAPLARLISTYLLLDVFALVFVFILVFFISRGLTKPLQFIQGKFHDISSGDADLSKELDIAGKDEIAKIGSNFNTFLAKLRHLVIKVKDDSRTLSSLSMELASTAEQTSTGIRSITTSVGSVAESIRDETRKTQDSSTELQTISSEVDRIQKLTDQIKNQVSSTSSAIEEMSANILTTASLAQKADGASIELEKAAEEGNQFLEGLNQSIAANAESSIRITEMVQLIMDITNQTNLLAMNAAIEAAHAGDFGKGFAVVADEIRKLADMSGQSAKEIQEVVSQITLNIQRNQEMSSQTQDRFSVLLAEVGKVRQSNKEIAFSMEEQQSANQSILESTHVLNELSDHIHESLRDQSNRIHQLQTFVQDLARHSQDILGSVDLEKQALNEASVSTNTVSTISQKLKDLATSIEGQIVHFKT